MKLLLWVLVPAVLVASIVGVCMAARTVYILFLLPLAYLAWRVTWAPQRSSKPGWVLIVVMGVLWASACSPGLVFYGEAFVGVLALELWSRQRLHRRLEGRPALEAKLVWRILFVLVLLIVWIPVGERIWELGERYYDPLYGGIPPLTPYEERVLIAVWGGFLRSVFAYGAVGVVRNVVGLVLLFHQTRREQRVGRGYTN